MPQSFKLDADALRSWLQSAQRNGGKIDWEKFTPPLQRAIEMLYRLEKLKHNLDASDPEDDEQTEKMARELAALLGLRCRS